MESPKLITPETCVEVVPVLQWYESNPCISLEDTPPFPKSDSCG
jgi:hypothetical protein